MSDSRPTAPRTTPDGSESALDRGWRERARANGLWLMVTLVLTGLVLVPVLQLWRADPHVPVSLGIDNEFSLMVIKNVLREGWANQTQHLGAPFGQQLYDFPTVAADVLHLLVIKGIGLLSDDPALVMNWFYGLTFFIVSACAFLALRMLKISPAVASAAAILYSFLPYHFVRGGYYGHLTLSAYYAVPLACALCVRQLGDEPLLELRSASTEGREARLKRSRAALALVICVLVALTGVYYAVFTIFLLAFAGVARALAARSLRPLLSSLVLTAVTVTTLAIALLPNLMYIRGHGLNQEVARRVPTESEIYGLKIVNLVLPTPDHRIEALDNQFGERSVLPGEGTETLGFVGAAGFIGLVLTAFRRLLGPSRSVSAPTNSMASLVLFTVLLGTVAGFSAVFASFGLVQIRAWNRLSVFVGFLALGAVALAIDRLSARASGLRVAVARLVLALLVLLVGILDQTTASFVPRYEEVSRMWRADDAFIQAVERRYGQADVFQLPIMPFPEPSPVGKLFGNTQLRGYLHSDALRWSFGGMRGRESDWQDQLLPLPPLEVVPRLALAGFEALYIDRGGYEDHAVEVERQLGPYLGKPLVSADDRLAVYDLRPIQRQLEGALGASRARTLRQMVIHPIRLQWSSEFDSELRTQGVSWRSAESNAEVSLVNGKAERRRVVFAFDLTSPPETEVRVETDDRAQALRFPGGQGRLQLELSLRPGATKVRFRTEPARTETSFVEGVPRRNRVGITARPAGDRRFSVTSPRVDEGGPDLAPLLRPTPEGPSQAQVVPAPRARRRSSSPPLVLGAVVIWSLVVTAVVSACLDAVLYPTRRWQPPPRRPVPSGRASW